MQKLQACCGSAEASGREKPYSGRPAGGQALGPTHMHSHTHTHIYIYIHSDAPRTNAHVSKPYNLGTFMCTRTHTLILECSICKHTQSIHYEQLRTRFLRTCLGLLCMCATQYARFLCRALISSHSTLLLNEGGPRAIFQGLLSAGAVEVPAGNMMRVYMRAHVCKRMCVWTWT